MRKRHPIGPNRIGQARLEQAAGIKFGQRQRAAVDGIEKFESEMGVAAAECFAPLGGSHQTYDPDRQHPIRACKSWPSLCVSMASARSAGKVRAIPMPKYASDPSLRGGDTRHERLKLGC